MLWWQAFCAEFGTDANPLDISEYSKTFCFLKPLPLWAAVFVKICKITENCIYKYKQMYYNPFSTER